MRKWKKYKYKNLTFLFISLLITVFLFNNESFHTFLLHLGNLGYFGAFIAGILYISTFTAAPGALILIILAEKLSPIELGLIAGVGGVLGDFIIFQFIRSKGLISEIKNVFKYMGGDKVSHLLHTKYFMWTMPVLGALIIASPFPDELGVSLLSISRMKTYQFIVVSFVLDVVGIFLIIFSSNFIKP